MKHTLDVIDQESDALIIALEDAKQKYEEEISSEGFIPPFINKELLTKEELIELGLVNANTTVKDTLLEIVNKSDLNASKHTVEFEEEVETPYLSETMNSVETHKQNVLTKATTKKVISPSTKTQQKQDNATTKNKVIYLTFDDGPLMGTSNVMKALRDENVVGTMFVVGEHIQRHKGLFKKLLNTKHIVVANHTYSHAQGKYQDFYENTKLCVSDIIKAEKLLKKYVDSPQNMRYFPVRLAGRNVYRLAETKQNDLNLPKHRRLIEEKTYNTLAKRGFQLFGWDYEWKCNYYTGKPLYTSQKILENIERRYHTKRMQKSGHMILLLHDYMFRTKYDGYNNLRALIRGLKEKGWKFGLLHEYI
jgi:peptidoglycan/xylan/chitin deacetylase (PgdA/CDA1 family)